MTDYPSVAMAKGKFPALPTLMGFTTDELIDRIPLNANFTTDESLLAFSTAFLSYVNPVVLAEEVKLYDPAHYADIGPPGSGTQWSRVVAIDNDLQSFCPLHHAAVDFAGKASVWKCKSASYEFLLDLTFSIRSIRCSSFNIDQTSLLESLSRRRSSLPFWPHVSFILVRFHWLLFLLPTPLKSRTPNNPRRYPFPVLQTLHHILYHNPQPQHAETKTKGSSQGFLISTCYLGTLQQCDTEPDCVWNCGK
jgi:hypothetical protein